MRVVAIVLLLLGGPVGAAAQSMGNCMAGSARPGVGAALQDYGRAASLVQGAPRMELIRRGGGHAIAGPACLEGVWQLDTIAPRRALSATPMQVDAVFNSAYPAGRADGLLWAGRGASSMASFGVQARIGVLSASLEPAVSFQQNRDFEFVQRRGRSEYAYPWHRNIDWPIRFGDDGYADWSLGQSFVRVDMPWAAFGVSSENLWWGPGLRRSLIMTNEGPGFPHAFLGSREGWRTPVGRFHGELVWGRLSESAYFDSVAANDRRLFTGVTVAWEPPGNTGLSLGLARVYQREWEPDSWSLYDFVPFFESPLKNDLMTEENPSGNDVADQLVSVFGRYALPGTGFEVYAEWARNDHAADMQDLFAEPDHARAYTFGFQQVLGSGNERWYRIQGEFMTLNTARPVAVRPIATWYTNTRIRQGYTHRGQLLGAGIGPGSDARSLGFDIFTTRGKHGVFFEHVRYNENAHYVFVTEEHWHRGHDVELTGGMQHVLRLGDFLLEGGLSYSSRRNRHFRHCNDEVQGPLFCQKREFRDGNWQLSTGLLWQPM